MTANVKYTVEQRRLLQNSRTLPIGWLWFTLVQTGNMRSKLPT